MTYSNQLNILKIIRNKEKFINNKIYRTVVV